MAKLAAQAQWSLNSYSIGLNCVRCERRSVNACRLAAETGLSTALLCQKIVEMDRWCRRFQDVGHRRSYVYGVGMSHFFTEATRHTVSITRKAQSQDTAWPGAGADHAVERTKRRRDAKGKAGGGRMTLRTDKCGKGTEESGCRAGATDGVRPGGAASIPGWISEGQRRALCARWRLRLDSGGMHEFLETGDCAFVDTDMTMAWSAAGKQRCRILAVFPGADPK